MSLKATWKILAIWIAGVHINLITHFYQRHITKYRDTTIKYNIKKLNDNKKRKFSFQLLLFAITVFIRFIQTCLKCWKDQNLLIKVESNMLYKERTRTGN